MLLHASHRWPQAVNAHLWPQALKLAVDLRNSLPRHFDRDSPLSTFAGVTIEPNLNHFHPFGCPVYVLETPLQSGSFLPRWSKRSQVGIYLCRSPHHASYVALVLNPQTGHVSPQFHLVFDDHFDTVKRDAKFESLWQAKAKFQQPVTSTSDDNLVPTTKPLIPYESQPLPPNLQAPWYLNKPSEPNSSAREGDNGDNPPANPPSEGVNTVYEGACRTRSRIPTTAQQNASPHQHENTDHTNREPTRRSATHTTRSGRTIKPAQKAQESPLVRNKLLSFASEFVAIHDFSNPVASFLTAFAATTCNNPDTMTLEQALKQPDREHFINAMIKELEDHTARGHWEIVSAYDLPKGTKPIPMVWSMKRKIPQVKLSNGKQDFVHMEADKLKE